MSYVASPCRFPNPSSFGYPDPTSFSARPGFSLSQLARSKSNAESKSDCPGLSNRLRRKKITAALGRVEPRYRAWFQVSE